MHPYEGSFAGIGGSNYTTNTTLDDLVTDALEIWRERFLSPTRSNPFREASASGWGAV